MILGGGIAGLSVGYFAKKQGYSFKILESTKRIGGNCITFSHRGFLFDSGAHRFHNKYIDVTKEVLELLNANLHEVSAPSQIYDDGRFFDFPISPLR